MMPEARALAERLGATPSIENLKALEALRNHRKHVETSRAYADTVAAGQPPSPPLLSRIEEIPDVTQVANTKSKRPKQVTILKVGLPLSDPKGKGKAKEVTPPIDDGEEVLDWGSDDENVDMDTAEPGGLTPMPPRKASTPRRTGMTTIALAIQWTPWHTIV